MASPRPSSWQRTSSRRPDPEPVILKRDGHVIFSPLKPPMEMKFWNIRSLDQLKRSLMSWLEGDYQPGEVIRRIQRLRTRFSFETGETIRWWVEVESDIDCIQMMHGSDDIVLTVVIS